MELGTNIHHVSAHCWKGFRGQRSKVKIVCLQICECCNGRAMSTIWSRL